MEKPKYVFVDSNVWIALYNENDALHGQAKKAFTDIEKSGSRILISDYIIQETFTVLCRLQHQSMALSFYEFITHHTKADIMDMSSFFLKKLIQFIEKRRFIKPLGLIDYSVIFFGLLVNCPILSFDQQLVSLAKQTGVKISLTLAKNSVV